MLPPTRATQQSLRLNLVGTKVQYISINHTEPQIGEYRGYTYDKRKASVILKIKPAVGYSSNFPLDSVTPLENVEMWEESMALLREFQREERQMLEYDILAKKIEMHTQRREEIRPKRRKYLYSGRRHELKRLLVIK